MSGARLLRNLLLALLSIGLAGCAGGPRTAKREERLLFFPHPPVPPRVQFLTWASGAAEVEPEPTGLEAFLLDDGERKRRPRIVKPFGLAVHKGVVYVCDTKGICISKLDYVNHKFSTFGTDGPGKVRKPINIVIDDLGFKFVSDPMRNEILIYDPDDRYVKAYRLPEPSRVVDMALHGNEIYALDNDKTPQVVVLDRTSGKVLRTFGSAGREPGQFAIPNSIAIGPEGFVYISDPLLCRIQKLTPEGEPVWTRGTPGYHLGQFGRPRGLRVGPDGIIYVVDAATEIVQMYDSEGNVLMHFGGPGTVPGALYLPSSLAIDRSSIPLFKDYVHPDFRTEYLLFVASQYGPHLISIYAFGSFPEGYQLSESEVKTLPKLPEGNQPGEPGKLVPIPPDKEQGGDGSSGPPRESREDG